MLTGVLYLEVACEAWFVCHDRTVRNLESERTQCDET